MYTDRRCCSSNGRRRRPSSYTHAHTRPDAAMLDFGCGTDSHSHFQFVTVSQTAAGRRLARTPLAGRPAGSRRVFNKLLVIYISAAVICVPSATARAGRRSPIPTSPLPTCGRDMRRRRSRGAGRIVIIYIYTSGKTARKQVLVSGGRHGNADVQKLLYFGYI